MTSLTSAINIGRTLYGTQLPERDRQLERDIGQVFGEMNARGVLHSGMTISRLNDIAEAELRSRIRLAWDSLQRALAGAGLSITAAEAEHIRRELRELSVGARQRLREAIQSRVSFGHDGLSSLTAAAEEALAAASAELDLAVLAGEAGTWSEVSGSAAHVGTVPPPEGYEYDVFISHASEDKATVARPLAAQLNQTLRVWLDEQELTIGDSLRRKIDRGLSRSRYGIVILSPSFFAKEWPQKELDGLAAREVGGQKVILPVWHLITLDKVRSISPMLADRLAGNTEKGIPALAERLRHAIRSGV